METQNVTLSLPKRLLRRAKVLAAERDTSVSALMRDLLQQFVENEDGYERARKRQTQLMRRGIDMGLGAEGVTWTRDEVHDRP